MPIPQCKNTSVNNKENVSPPKSSNPIVIGFDKSSLAESQDKDFKITIMARQW